MSEQQFAQVSLAALDYERRVQLSLNAAEYRTAHSLPFHAPVPVEAFCMTPDERALCTFRAHPVGTRVYARDGSGRQGTVVGSTDGLYPILVRFDEYPTAGHAVPGAVESVLFPDVQDEAIQTQHLRDEAQRTMDEAAEYERAGTRPSASGNDLFDRILHDRVERGIYSDAEQFAIRLLIDEEREADAGIDYEATVAHAGSGQPDWATDEADRRAASPDGYGYAEGVIDALDELVGKGVLTAFDAISEAAIHGVLDHESIMDWMTSSDEDEDKADDAQ